MDLTQPLKAACHCGAVQFTVQLTDGFKTARRCTCSYCRMRGAGTLKFIPTGDRS